MQDNFFILMLQSVAALALVLALFAVLVWGFRKLQFRQLPQGEVAMRVVQRLAIDTRHTLVEVEHGGRRYLLGLSPAGMSTISDAVRTDPAPDHNNARPTDAAEI